MRYYRPRDGFSRSGFSFGPGAISPFIKVMIISNVAIFIAQNIFPQITNLFGLSTDRFLSDFPNLLYQPFTYMFLHGGFWHIFFNMFILWMFGTEIEHSWGSRRFGLFYIVSGLCGAILPLFFQSSQAYLIVGASGAIYGLLAVYWIMFPNRYLYIYFLFPVKVKWAIPGLLILGFLIGSARTSNLTHLGGFLFGLLYMKASWRFVLPGKKIKQFRYRRQVAKLEKNRQKADEIMKRVDDILDKINDVGIENITKEERKFLEEASSKLSKRKIND